MDKNTKKQNKKLEGILEKIIFKNPQNDYIVGRLRLEKDNRLVTIVGNVPELQSGEKLEVEGKWIFNKKYGEQFEIECIKTLAPTTIKGIEKYLGSGLIKGIGPVMAKRIVSQFKLGTLSILDKEPQRLKEIEGFGDKRVEVILEAWKKHKNIRELVIFLQSYNIGNTYAVKIYNKYEKNSINVIKSNPYRLSEDIFGIGFKTADSMAQKLGIKKDSMFRIKAAVIYLLNEIDENGHCFYPYEQFLDTASNFIEADIKKIISAVEELKKDNKLCIVENGYKKIYLKKVYDSEIYVSEKLKLINKTKKQDKIYEGDFKKETFSIIRDLTGENKIELDDIQLEAVSKAVTEKVIVITGSPGTGKSTILDFIIKIFEKKNKKVVLAAPTGRASKRLTEATQKEAKTIHRLLEYNPKLNKFVRDEQNPITADVIIIDEASMLDIGLMKNLLKAIKSQSCLIMVGDIDQLPAVGPGNVLADIINSKEFSVVKLKNIYRQEGKSLIIYNAHRIRDGMFPYLGNSKYKDFYFIEKNEPENVVHTILSLVSKRIPSGFGYNPFYDIQILVPTNKGEVGVKNLNYKIQDKLNKGSLKINVGENEFRLGDKVIQRKNNYEKDVYNGDIGFIKNIDFEMQELVVEFNQKPVFYNFFDLDEISLSYAISIHKSQGSEFKCVIVPILTSHYMLLQRNLLYTAITRARELAILIGNKKAIGIAINKCDVENRYTSLCELLQT